MPKHWPVKRIKYLARVCAAKVDAKPDTLPYIGLENIESKTGRLLLADSPNEVDSSVIRFRHGDILFAKLRPYLAKAAMPQFDGVGTTELLVLRPGPEVRPRFLLYRFLDSQLIHFITSLTFGAKMPRVATEQVVNLSSAVPPLNEQDAIVAFLEAKDAEIHTFIDNQRRQVDLLKEYKVVLLNGVITRGLNRNGFLRVSGIPWLSMMPSHWEVTKLRHLARVGNGSTPSRSDVQYWTNGTYPWLNSSVVNQYLVVKADQFVTEKALNECHLPKVAPGSVLVAITGQGKTRGTAALLKFEATINQHIAYITLTSDRVSSGYLHILLTGLYGVLRVISDGEGSTKGALTCEDLKHLKLPLPPREEQARILDHIQRETNAVETAVASAEREITGMEEYRTALISAAVTGRIDVRYM